MATLAKSNVGFRVVRGTTAQRNSLNVEDLRGLLFFDTTEKSVYLNTTDPESDDELTLERVCGDVKNVTWSDSKKQLTITPFSGSAVTIDLSTSSLSQAITAIQTSLEALTKRVDALEKKTVNVTGNLVTNPNTQNPSVDFSAQYWSASKKIKFYKTATAPTTDNGTEIGSIDATAFIKDGMINNVTFNASTKKLTITFNTDAGKSNIDVDMSALVDVYTADGQGIKVASNKFSIVLATDGLLKKDANGLAIDKTALLNHLKSQVVISMASAHVTGSEYPDDSKENDPSPLDSPIFDVSDKNASGQVTIGVNPAELLEKINQSSNVTLKGIDITGEFKNHQFCVTVDATPKWFTVK